MPGIAQIDLARLALAAVCWGLGTVISKQALTELAPITLLTAQLAVSVGVVAIVLRVRGTRLSAPRGLARLGLLNPGLAYALSLLGLVSISASLSVILWALEPLLIIVLAALTLGERLSRSLIALTGMAVLGTVIVAYDPAINGALVGVLLTLAGIGCCAVYSVAARRWLPGADSTADVVLLQQAHALAFALAALLVAGIVGRSPLPVELTAPTLVSAVVSGLLYYAAAYWFYLGALRDVPASRAVVSFYLIPIVGIVASFAWLGERLEPRQLVGAAIVLVAVVASARQPGSASLVAADRPAESPAT